MGTVDDLAVAPAKTYSATSRVWICRSGRQGQAKRVIGAASEGATQQLARVSCPKWGRRMARNPAHQEDCLIPLEKPNPQTAAENPPFADELHTHIPNS